MCFQLEKKKKEWKEEDEEEEEEGKKKAVWETWRPDVSAGAERSLWVAL